MEKEIYEKLSTISYETQIISSLLSVLAEYSLDKSIHSLEITNIYNLLNFILERQKQLSSELNSMI